MFGRSFKVKLSGLFDEKFKKIFSVQITYEKVNSHFVFIGLTDAIFFLKLFIKFLSEMDIQNKYMGDDYCQKSPASILDYQQEWASTYQI